MKPVGQAGQGLQSAPPQSTPVSSASCTPLPQQVPQLAPPQSTPVSSPFCIPSVQVGKEQDAVKENTVPVAGVGPSLNITLPNGSVKV